jgi:hypothetical protein
MAGAREKTISAGGSRRSIDWWLVAVLLIPVLYFLPELLGYNVFAGIDTSRLNMPLRFFDREAFRAGAFPLWNPYLFAGFPQLAESESGVLYPGNIFIHLPGDFFHWYSVEVVAHFMIAAAGFYTWMRIRKESRIASAFLAATYCTTPFLIFHITAFGLFTSIVWLPWYLVIFENGMNGKYPVRTGLGLALFLAMMLMSGSVQAAFLGVLALILFAIGKIIAAPASERKFVFVKAFSVLAPGLLAPVIAAIQILPTAELSALSERAATNSIDFFKLGTWMNIPRLISIVVFPALDNPADIQDYGSSLVFMGVAPFVLAVTSMALWRTNGRKMFPLIFVGIITLFLGFGLNLPGYTLLVKFPPFSMFRYAGRAEFVALTMFLAMAAPSISHIWSNLTDKIKFDNRLRTWLYAALSIVMCSLLIFMTWFSRPNPALTLTLGVTVFTLLLTVVTGKWSMVIQGQKVFVSILVVSLLVQIILTYPFSRILVQKRPQFDKSLQFFDDIKTDFPSDQEIPRVLIAGGQYLMDPDALSKLGFKAQDKIWDNMSGNASGLKGVTALNGLTPLNQNNWKEVLRDILQPRIENALKVAKANGTAPVADEISMRVIRMLGTDVLLLEGDNWKVPGFLLWRSDLELPYHKGFAAYRPVEGWIPDAYFTSRPHETIHYEATPLQLIASPKFDLSVNPAVIVPGMEFHMDRPATPFTNGKINSRSRGFNWFKFDVSVDGPGDSYLVTGENRDPGWNCYIDGRESGHYWTNYLFMGNYIPKGNHTVEFRYEPESVRKGMNLTFAALGMWLLLMILSSWRFPKTQISQPPSVEEKNPIHAQD